MAQKINYFTRNKIIVYIIATIIGIQFIPIERTNPPIVPDYEFLNMKNPPENIAHFLRTSCYDCHSNETNFPWYAYVAPVSWIVTNDIDDGRKHLNFSEWGLYPSKRANHKLEEIVEEVKEGEMPLSSYVFMHSEARLSEKQRAELVNWFKSLKKSVK